MWRSRLLLCRGMTTGAARYAGWDRARGADRKRSRSIAARGDAAMVAHGKTLYEIHCRLRHRPDLRGGEQSGSNLMRSPVTLNDEAHELLQPVVEKSAR